MSYVLPVYPYRKPPELEKRTSFAYPVIVVGAGMAGLTAALELGSRGVRTVLLDDDNTVGAAGLSSRGICHAKRSLEILDRSGVAARIRAKGVTWNEGEVYRGSKRLYRFNLQPEAGQKFPAFVNLQQFYVEQYLVERLQQMPEVDLRWKNKVVKVSEKDRAVHLRVETQDGAYELQTEYLLAADGAHSVVREQLGAKDAESELLESVWCIADVRMAGETDVVRKSYLDNPLNAGGAIWYHQMADGVWRTDWLITHYPDRDAEATPARAAERLQKLLGADKPFELVWVGPYRFRRRYLERLRMGRTFFLGDAAAQHSPFGARGGNRAVQDANNLAWKLALVLAGRAHPDLLDTYHDERHPATVAHVEHSTRAAVFIGPESPGQRLVRDAILDLAQREPWARAWVNTGRLSVASVYETSRLNRQRGKFSSDLAMPGAAAPDGRLGEGYFVERLGGDFCVVYFGGDGPSLQWQSFHVIERPLLTRYGVEGTATYVFRPDGHVLARCTGIDAAFARQAIEAVLNYRTGAKGAPGPMSPETGGMTQVQKDRLYDELAALVDATAPPERERVLARLAVALAERLGDYEALRDAINSARATPREGGSS
ncbi:MAG: FAD-dependent monooxygenase [Betaproteobacteria bacterium]